MGTTRITSRGRLAALAAALALATAGCSAPSLALPHPLAPRQGSSFEFTARYWQAKPDGHVEIEAGSQPATSTNAGLSDRLGLDSERELLWSAALDLGEHRIGVEYLPLSFGGSKSITRGFTFQGTPFPTGEDVSSDFDLDTWVFKWDYALSKEKRTADAFRVGVGAWWWNLDLEVKGQPSGASESREWSRIYPGVHLQQTMELADGARLEIYGALAANSYHRRLYDLGADLTYAVSDAIGLGVGYRWMIWDFNETNNDGDFDFSGPLANLTVRF